MPTYTAPGHPNTLADAIYTLASTLTAHHCEPDATRVALCEELLHALENSEALAADDMVFPGWEVGKRLQERPEFQRVNARRAAALEALKARADRVQKAVAA